MTNMAKKKMAKKKPTGAAAIKVISDEAPAAAGGAKKPGDHGFIADAIRAAAEANPGASVPDLQAKLAEKYPDQGFDKKYNMIYATIKKGGKKTKAKGKPGRKAKDASGAGNASAPGPIELAAKLVQAAGSMAEAKKALQTVEDIHNWARSLKTPF